MFARALLMPIAVVAYAVVLARWFHDPGAPETGLRTTSAAAPLAAMLVLLVVAGFAHRSTLAAMAAEWSGAWRVDRRHAGALVVALVVSLLAQVPAMLFPAGLVHSDAAINGLMALHISEGYVAPGFYYGQMFMGTLFSHVLAGLFAVTGPFVGGLAVTTWLFYGGFLLAVWLAVRSAAHPLVGAAVVVWLALPPAPLYTTLAQSEYPQLLLLSGWAMALAGARLAGVLRADAWWIAVGWLLGLAFWAHPAAALTVAAVAAAAFVHHDLAAVVGSAWRTAAGFLVGVLPALIAWGTGLGRFVEWFLAGGYRDGAASLAESAGGMASLSFAHLFGGVAESDALSWLGAVPLAAIVLGPAVWIVGRSVGARRRSSPPGLPVVASVLPLACFVLLHVGILVGRHGYAEAPIHYVVPIYLGVPATTAVALFAAARRFSPRRAVAIAATVVLSWAALSLPGTLALLRGLPSNQRTMDMSLDALRAARVDRCLAPYWDAYRISYLSLEQIVCDSVDVQRVPRYGDIVAQRSGRRPPPFVAAPQREAALRAQEQRLASRSIPTRRLDAGRFLVLIPER